MKQELYGRFDFRDFCGAFEHIFRDDRTVLEVGPGRYLAPSDFLISMGKDVTYLEGAASPREAYRKFYQVGGHIGELRKRGRVLLQLAHEPIGKRFDATLLFKTLYKLGDGYARLNGEWEGYERRVLENCLRSSDRVVVVPETARLLDEYEGLVSTFSHRKYSVLLPAFNGRGHWQNNSVHDIYVLSRT